MNGGCAHLHEQASTSHQPRRYQAEPAWTIEDKGLFEQVIEVV